MFEGINFQEFWDDSDYATKEYIEDFPTDELIKKVEQDLGYQLPASYVWLMKQHNGGIPLKTCFPTEVETSWAEDHIAITGIMGIGYNKNYAICGTFGSRFMIEEWGYPDIGIAICDCPSAGHDMIFLDYRECGDKGEPKVVHVAQDDHYKITYLAENFESFVKGLVSEEVYDTSLKDQEEDMRKVRSGAFSPLLKQLCQAFIQPQYIEDYLRTLAEKIVQEKGYFALHADEASMHMYDLQFLLYTYCYSHTTCKQYLQDYPKILVLDGEFSTEGYAPSFVEDWLSLRKKEGFILNVGECILLSEEAKSKLLEEIFCGDQR